MEGYGYVKELPAELMKTQDVMIFHGNGAFKGNSNNGAGVWSKLKPGHGAGFKSDGIKNLYSNRFGAELTLGLSLSKRFPNKKIAFIKYAVGGTGLHPYAGYGSWSPQFREGNGKNQYDFALNTISNAYAINDIDRDGEDDTLVPAGIIWMQGEADAEATRESAKTYLANLTQLIALLRAAFRKDDIPVVIGKITDSNFGKKDLMPYIRYVHKAQEAFVKQDICAGYMTKTETYAYTKEDVWHYNSEGFIQMGADFAEVYSRLANTCVALNHQ